MAAFAAKASAKQSPTCQPPPASLLHGDVGALGKPSTRCATHTPDRRSSYEDRLENEAFVRLQRAVRFTSALQRVDQGLCCAVDRLVQQARLERLALSLGCEGHDRSPKRWLVARG